MTKSEFISKYSLLWMLSKKSEELTLAFESELDALIESGPPVYNEETNCYCNKDTFCIRCHEQKGWKKVNGRFEKFYLQPLFNEGAIKNEASQELTTLSKLNESSQITASENINDKLKEVFDEIKDYQMNHISLAMTTPVYKLAEKGLKLLEIHDNKKS